MPRCGRPARRAVSRPVCADETNSALSEDRKLFGTSTIGPHPARLAPAVAPVDPHRSADPEPAKVPLTAPERLHLAQIWWLSPLSARITTCFGQTSGSNRIRRRSGSTARKRGARGLTPRRSRERADALPQTVDRPRNAATRSAEPMAVVCAHERASHVSVSATAAWSRSSSRSGSAPRTCRWSRRRS